MHGAIRNLRKASKLEFREGDRVRLRPRKKADIFDIALEGRSQLSNPWSAISKTGFTWPLPWKTIPGRDFGVARQIGHRFFFAPEEVELL